MNDLDAAVFEAYGWPVALTDEEILERLVALNAERVAAEQCGQICWLRPEFQHPSGDQAKQKGLAIESDNDAPAEPKKKAAKAKKLKLPSSVPDQVAAIRKQFTTSQQPLTAKEVAAMFSRGKPRHSAGCGQAGFRPEC